MPDPSAVGLLLAAGAGRRMGTPKALVHDADGTSWLLRSVRVLRDGGCATVLVVLGSEHERAQRLLQDEPVTTVVATEWHTGMGASLRAGLHAAGDTGAQIAVVTLVDLPDVGPDVVARVTTAAGGAADLCRATYHGTPGHPVVLGRAHWPAIREQAAGDRGARAYLADHEVRLVECGDLAGGQDIDYPERLS